MTESSRPLRVAVIGSGPAAFFCAEYLLRLALPCEVCMFERMPTPFGLVRDGVAPDRMNIRSVTRAFSRVAAKEGFSWYGNVDIGGDIAVTELKKHFDAVVVASGASNPRRLDIQGEGIAGCYSATAFAGWYNARLVNDAVAPDLSHPTAVIIGAGNAALDVARILATPPDTMAASDISGEALEALRESAVREIHVVARRGPTQVRFTPEELEHIARIPSCGIVMHADMDWCEDQELPPENLRLLEAYNKLTQTHTNESDADRRIHFHFSLTPFGIMGDDRVSGALFMDDAGGALHIQCGLVVTSIGHVGLGIDGLPFDEERGIIPNAAGRVLRDGAIMPGVYAAGWIKRGADGVIGTNKPCCRETVQSVMDDRERICDRQTVEAPDIPALLKQHGVEFITYEDWLKIDAAEKARGKDLGKDRERFQTLDEIRALLG